MLGDYIDRGPQSDEVIELLTSRRLDARTICLMGNHETYLLDFLRDPASLAEWQHNGGLETLMSYGLAPSLNPTADDQKQLAALLAERLPTHHYDFLMTLPLSFDCGDYFFVHAGVRPGVALSDQRAEDLLLIREEFLHPGLRQLIERDLQIILARKPEMRPAVLVAYATASAEGKHLIESMTPIPLS